MRQEDQCEELNYNLNDNDDDELENIRVVGELQSNCYTLSHVCIGI